MAEPMVMEGLQSMSDADDAHYMGLALLQARRAELRGEVPVGAIVVNKVGEVIAEGFNQTITLHDPTAHAEVVALRAAALAMQNYRLPDASLYVTLEPCVMCMGAIMHARVKRVVFGARDPKTGVCGSVIDLSAERRLNHHADVIGGVMGAACADVLTQFFRQRRG